VIGLVYKAYPGGCRHTCTLLPLPREGASAFENLPLISYCLAALMKTFLGSVQQASEVLLVTKHLSLKRDQVHFYVRQYL